MKAKLGHSSLRNVPFQRLEVDDLRGIGGPREGHKPRSLYLCRTEFFQSQRFFALEELHLLQDFAGYLSEVVCPQE